ncbi:MAG: branched-chain amino acid ABC transporter permease [Syntrophorhabdales bacterium]|jgi:branched-chain amino acid transport system permease protein
MSYILESVISGLLLGGIYALLSVGFGLTWGTMKVLNISHAVFAVLGAFIAYWLFVKAKIDPLLSLPFLAAVMFLVGAIVYKLAIRPVTKAKDVVMASMVATFGVATVVENLMSFFWRPDPRVLKPVYSGSSLFIGNVAISEGPLVGFAMSLCSIALLYWFLHRTYTGKGVQATWQNPTGAALVGINPERVSLITFGLSIASAGVAGVAMAMIYAFYPSVQSVWTLFVFLVTIVGGVGSVIGSGLAGLLIGFIIGVSAAFLPFVWTNVLLFALLLVVLLLKPEGLFAS